MYKILTYLIISFIPFVLHAQDRCGTNKLWNYNTIKNPELIDVKHDLESKISNYLKRKSANSNEYYIPVVVHVLFNSENELISENQILSQIQVLNDDFRRDNADAINTPAEFLNIASDTKINFCLAKRTPNNDTTSGITYTSTDIESFSLYDNRIFLDSLGGKNIWDPSKFLNIYVCNLSNALGFSSFPGGSTHRDGVVINYTNFGTTGNIETPYDKGRTATHEIGHWLNLFHIWGDNNCGSDMVDDTPVQESANYGCPSHPSISCQNNGDMFQNYMDYTNDICMNLFTEGQKERMHATLNIERTDVSNQASCELPYEDVGIIENIFPKNNEIVCGSNLEIITSVYNFSEKAVENFVITYQLDNQETIVTQWNEFLNPNQSVELNLGNINTSVGIHQLKIYTSLPNNYRDLNMNNDTLIIDFEVKNGTVLDVEILADNYGDEISWNITDEFGQISFEGDSLTSNELYQNQLCLDNNICYTFSIFDQQNDGICCDFGNGYFSLNNQLFSGNYDNQFNVDLCQLISVNDFKDENLHIYPNPSKGEINIESNSIIHQLNLYDIDGKLVFQSEMNSKYIRLNLNNINTGIYILESKTEKEINYNKLIIN